MMRATVLDYGVGNLHSLAKAVATPGVEVRIEADPLRALDTTCLLLPGVGAFTPAANHLAPARTALREALLGGLPCLGICLGMQLLLDGSDEGPGEGLGIIGGRVRRLRARRVPQIGWNTVDGAEGSLETAYYANGFVVDPTDATAIVAWSTHEGDRFPAMIRQGNTMGVQFHPEKSSLPGVSFLRNWLTTMGAR